MATLPEGKPVKAVHASVSSLDELHTGDHILYQDHDSWYGYCSALVTNEPEDGHLGVITNDFTSHAREETLQLSSLTHLHKVQYTPCQYSGEEAVSRARSGGPRYYDSHELVSWAKTGVKHSLSTIIEELKAQCGEPVKAVRVSSPDELHTGDHILYQDTHSGDGYHSALVASEPEDGRLRFITKESFMSHAREETSQFFSLPHLRKVQYTPCQYSGEEAVQRARSGGPRYSDSHKLVSWAKTGVKHSLSTIIEELKAQWNMPAAVRPNTVPVSSPRQRHTEFRRLYQDHSDSGYSGSDVSSTMSSDLVSVSSKQPQNDCATVSPIAPIRGCTIVAERNFPITQKAEVFNWPEYGISISAPENAIPEKLADTQSTLLNVRVSLSGPFQLGASKLMSAVYWICPDIRCKFAEPLELTVEHCAHLTHPDDHTKLAFLRTKCNQKDLPYQFEEIGGEFTAHSGTVALRSFSGVAVGSKAAESTPPPMKYVARIATFQTHVTEWKALYAALKDLKSFRAFDSEKKFASDPFTTTYTSLKFKEDTVRLDLPVDGVTVKDGNWRILPLVPPRLSIPDGESVPECSFVIEWVGSGKPSTTLHHIVTLSGTADKDDFFALRVNPDTKISGPTSVKTSPPDTTTNGEDTSLSRLHDKPSISELVDEATGLKPQTLFILAIKLGLTKSDVDQIEAKTSDPLRRYMELFDLWETKASSPYTWETLVKALEEAAVGEQAKAAELRKKLSHP